MVFSSLEFLFLYLPVVTVIYFISPRAWRNLVLLLFSLIFYGWGEPKYVFLMIFTVAVDYLFGLFIGKCKKQSKRAKVLLTLAVTVNLGILGYFKYADFLIDSFSFIKIINDLPRVNVPLPVGISFYTFQALSYVIDVYRDGDTVQRDPIKFGTYITMFPQLVAGPIVRYDEIKDDLETRKTTLPYAVYGIRRFAVGLSKKVLIGNTAGALWKAVYTLPSESISTVGAWFGIVCFTFQIYFDFSGYSDMAIGLGRIFGFNFPENFYYPYTSKSISEFWRRWHITLSEWFREYVYIPLGGNRRGKARTYLNLLAVWCLTGLWHGARLNFLLWGLYYFILLALERLFLRRALERMPKAFAWGYTMLFVVLGWLIFAFDGSQTGLGNYELFTYVGKMLGIGTFVLENDIYDITRNLPFLFIGVIAATPYPRRVYYKIYEKTPTADIASSVLCVIAFVLCTAYLVSSAYNPFLYFRF